MPRLIDRARRRYIWPGIPLLLVIIIAVSLLLYKDYAQEEARQNAYDRLSRSLIEKNATFKATLDGQFAILDAFAGAIAAQENPSSDDIRSRMYGILHNTQFKTLRLADPDGNAWGVDAVVNVAERDYFHASMAGRHTVERVAHGLVSGLPRIILSVPVAGNEGVRQVLYAVYDEDVFRNLFLPQGQGHATHSFICDRQGSIVLGSDSKDFLLQNLNVRTLFQEHGNGEAWENVLARVPGVVRYTVEGQVRYAVHAPLGFNGWTIFNATTGNVVDAEARTILWGGYRLGGLLFSVTLLLLGGGLLLSRRETRRMVEEGNRARADAERIRIALENTTVTIWDYDHRKHCIIQPPTSIARHGFETVVPNVPQSLVDSGYVHPDSVDAFLDMYARLAAGAPRAEGVFRMRTADRTDWWYEHIHYTNLFDDAGQPYRAIGMSEDVTSLHEARLLYEQEMALQQVLAPDICCSGLCNLRQWNLVRVQYQHAQEREEGATSIYDLCIQAARHVVNDEDVRHFFLSISPSMLEERFARGESVSRLEYLRQRDDGTTHWARTEIRLIHNPATNDLMAFFSTRDITAEKDQQESLIRAAETDAMTGLYNHEASFRHMNDYLHGEGRAGHHALFMVDIDNFKSVNDILGHQQGDNVIITTAAILRRTFRAHDIIGRVGGDEFLVLMKNLTNASLLHQKATTLLEALQLACSSPDGATLQTSASIGVGCYTGDGESFKELYARADAALYAAKNAGKNRIHIGDAPAIPATRQPHATIAETSSTIQLHALLEHMQGGVLLIEVGEKTSRTLYVSPSFYAITGRTRAEVAHSKGHLMHMVHPDFREDLQRRIQEAACHNTVLDASYRSISAQERLGWRHIRAVRIPYEGSALPVLIAVITDITELRRTSALFESIVRNAPLGIGLYETGKNIRSIFHNDRLREQTGLDEAAFQEQLGQDISFIMRPEDVPQARIVFQKTLDDGRPRSILYRTAPRWGHERIIQSRCVRLEEGDDGSPCIMTFSRNITAQKRLESRLRDSNARLRFACEQMGILLWEMDIPRRTFGVWDIEQRRYREGTVFTNMPQGLTEKGLVHPSSLDEFTAYFQDLLEGKERAPMAAIVRYFRNQEYGWATFSYRIIRDRQGVPVKALGVTRELPNIFNEQTRLSLEERYREAVRHLLLATERVNLTRGIVLDCAGVEPLAQPGEKSMGRYFASVLQRVFGEKDQGRFTAILSPQALKNAYSQGIEWVATEYRYIAEDGKIRWVHGSFSLLADPVSGDLHGFGYLVDIDAIKRLEQGLPFRVARDASTGLPARSAAAALIHALIQGARQDQGYCALAVVELDGLRQCSDRSMDIASKLLQSLCRLFRAVCSREYVIGHEDQCALLLFLPHTPSRQAAVTSLKTALDAILHLKECLGLPEELGFSTGMAVSEKRLADYTILHAQARAACRPEHGQCNIHGGETPASGETPADGEELAARREEKRRDRQTGLRNRQDYYNMLQQARPDALFAVGALFLDINSLGALNRRYGYQHGDDLILFVADTLKRVFSDGDVYRTSGDEFLALCQGIAQDRFTALCREACNTWNEAYPGQVSAGWIWSAQIHSMSKLIAHAEERMAMEKKTRRDGKSDDVFRATIQRRLTEGMAQRRFPIFLQPKFSARDGSVVGAEALVRYDNPEKGLCQPDAFLPQLERENLVALLDLHVLEQVLHLLRQWKTEGRTPLPISCNFSRKTFLAASSLQTLQLLLRDDEDLRSLIEIEITESAGSMERATLAELCAAYHAEGVRLSLDDFGSEYSSLYILSTVQFDTIKIDKSLIDDIVANDLARLTVENTRRICEKTHSLLLAEGVETEEQLAILRTLGCDIVQGYLYDKPLPVDEFTTRYLS